MASSVGWTSEEMLVEVKRIEEVMIRKGWPLKSTGVSNGNKERLRQGKPEEGP